jgi:hypothetical protein
MAAALQQANRQPGPLTPPPSVRRGSHWLQASASPAMPEKVPPCACLVGSPGPSLTFARGQRAGVGRAEAASCGRHFAWQWASASAPRTLSTALSTWCNRCPSAYRAGALTDCFASVLQIVFSAGIHLRITVQTKRMFEVLVRARLCRQCAALLTSPAALDQSASEAARLGRPPSREAGRTEGGWRRPRERQRIV